MDIRLNLTQKQQLSQQMIQSVQILQMSATEREKLPDSAEQMDLQRKLDWLSSTDRQNLVYYQGDTDRDDPENNWQDSRATEETLEDYLKSQLLLKPYSDAERQVILYLINALDDSGFFRDSLEETAELFSIPVE